MAPDTSTPERPFLSVIVPVLNRERFVLRALNSVLIDPAADVEVIVVDDGSTDATPQRVASIVDPRLQLVVLPENVGPCAARNHGARIAMGEWLVFLDSDDELIPGSLESIRQRAMHAAPGVGKLLFSCRNDSGAISPSPAFDGRTVDYVGYLQWAEETIAGSSEALPCTRREAFLQCPYPEWKHAREGVHELDFVQRFPLQQCPEVVRLYHFDADNRLMAPDAQSLIAGAANSAANAEAMLSRHGAAMRKYARARWIALNREAAVFGFLSGNRSTGVKESLAVLRQTPGDWRAWATLVAGVLSRDLLSRLLSVRRSRAVA